MTVGKPKFSLLPSVNSLSQNMTPVLHFTSLAKTTAAWFAATKSNFSFQLQVRAKHKQVAYDLKNCLFLTIANMLSARSSHTLQQQMQQMMLQRMILQQMMLSKLAPGKIPSITPAVGICSLLLIIRRAHALCTTNKFPNNSREKRLACIPDNFQENSFLQKSCHHS